MHIQLELLLWSSRRERALSCCFVHISEDKAFCGGKGVRPFVVNATFDSYHLCPAHRLYFMSWLTKILPSRKLIMEYTRK